MATPIRRKLRRGAPPSHPQRPLRTLALSLGEVARSALAEPFMLTIERRSIFLRRLPKALDGLRIVQLSDFHHGPLTTAAQLRRAVETANSLEPDIIALTGDYISHERRYAAPCAEVVGRLRARCGVYAVLGNHDHWTDAALITDLFRAEGITRRSAPGPGRSQRRRNETPARTQSDNSAPGRAGWNRFGAQWTYSRRTGRVPSRAQRFRKAAPACTQWPGPTGRNPNLCHARIGNSYSPHQIRLPTRGFVARATLRLIPFDSFFPVTGSGERP